MRSPVPTRFSRHEQDIRSVCRWKKANTQKAVKVFKLSKIFQARDIGADASVLFGDVPETYVHKGDVSLDTSMLLDAAGHGIFIIDGSLSVDGTFSFFADDAYTASARAAAIWPGREALTARGEWRGR